MTLTAQQTHWAQQIIAVVKSRNLPGDQGPRAADIALETALAESSLQNLANGNNPASMGIPHDGVGWDHGSVGVFQQQVGGAPNSTANWGTTAQCMDIHYATNTFLDHLLREDWLHATNWDAAQRVQGSFDPTGGNYKRDDALAIATRKQFWDAVPVAPRPPAPHPAPLPPHGLVGYYTVRQGDTLTVIAHRYPQSWVTAASIAAINHLANPDMIYPGQVLRIG